MKKDLEKVKQDLIRALSTFGHVKVAKPGSVLTIFLLRDKKPLSNGFDVVMYQQRILDIVGDRYPLIEVMVNDDDYFLLVLTPKK